MWDQEELNQIIQQLYLASEDRAVCRVSLKGELPRIIHVYGVTRTSTNKIVVVCWQDRGYTKSGTKGYRSIELSRITEVEKLDETFQIQPDINPDDTMYKEWVFHL